MNEKTTTNVVVFLWIIVYGGKREFSKHFSISFMHRRMHLNYFIKLELAKLHIMIWHPLRKLEAIDP